MDFSQELDYTIKTAGFGGNGVMLRKCRTEIQRLQNIVDGQRAVMQGLQAAMNSLDTVHPDR